MEKAQACEQFAPVHMCWNDTEADVIVSFLRTRGIKAHVASHISHGLFPLTVNGLGKVDILVNAQDAGRARALLAEQVRQQQASSEETTPPVRPG